MKSFLLVLFFFICLSSCKSSKKAHYKSNTHSQVIPHNTPQKKHYAVSNSNTITPPVTKIIPINKTKAEHIIDFAKDFEGVKYKWGGTTKAGMDCSGLVFESFRAFDIILPRISRDMAKQGEKISLNQVAEGDLLFFVTGNRRNSINHVGLVISTNNNAIQFIHATTKLGVTVSSLAETYWSRTFKEARKIL